MPEYVYVAGLATRKVWQIDPADMSKVAESLSYGGSIYALIADASYVYCGGYTTQKVWQIDPSDMSKVAESLDYGGIIYALTADASYVYAAGYTTQKVWQIDPSDMSKVAESLDYGGILRALTALGSYVYAAGATTQKVYQYDPTDMSKVAESLDYGGEIRALTADASYVYCGGYTTQKVWQIDPSDMSKVAESADYGGAIKSLTADASYIYAAGHATEKVFQYDPSDMSKVAESPGYGDAIYALTALGSYVYEGGSYIRRVNQIDPTDMSRVGQSANYGGDIQALAGHEYTRVVVVTIQPMTDVRLPTAKAHGTIISIGDTPCTQHGHCWNTTGTPNIDDDKTELGAGAEGPFESTLTDLLPSTPYYVRAYATDGEGTVYSDEIHFLAITETEINPTYVERHGGGLKTLSETEVKPTYFGEGGGGWNVFAETELSPLLPAPEVTTDPALWIGPLSATPHGTLDSGGGIEPCDCGFEWGETDSYGNTTPTQKKETGESFSQVIGGLLPNTLYHFRAFATGFGTSYGADRTFTTAPAAILATVTTDPATGRGAIAATINATLNQDGGEACECGFEWGLSTEYGTTTPPQSKTTGETFSQVIGGLAPGTTYHFRAFATNSVGTSYGADRSFATALVITRAHALAREEL